MSRWEEIRQARTDITDYVVHLTRFVRDLPDGKKEVRDEFWRLKRIIKSGYLEPTYAPRLTLNRNPVLTVKGSHPAICFTEQPLEQIPITINHLDGTGLQPYGIAFHKVDLFNYGGRPVIYGDESELESLPDDLKYRWVRYRPIRSGQEGYPNDFTFEREWRARVACTKGLTWSQNDKWMPLLLPDDFRRVATFSMKKFSWSVNPDASPDFRIIVKRDTEVNELREFINELAPEPKSTVYRRIYYAAMKKVQIISLEHIERKLEAGELYHRIEDLPAPPDDVVSLNPKKREFPFLKSR